MQRLGVLMHHLQPQPQQSTAAASSSLAPGSAAAEAAGFEGPAYVEYSSEHGLHLHIFTPSNDGVGAGENTRPGICFFFGGGWQGGTPDQFFAHARHLASRGMVCACAEYRTNRVLRECIDDATMAMRFLREHAGALHLDTSRLISAGGSAGGHIAAALAVCRVEAHTDSRPNACVLFNPALDIVRMLPEEQEGEVFSRADCPMTALSDMAGGEIVDRDAFTPRKWKAPTMLILHGEADSTCPFALTQTFAEQYKRRGGNATLAAFPGVGHGWFNQGAPGRSEGQPTLDHPIVGDGLIGKVGTPFSETLAVVDEFLVELEYIPGPAVAAEVIAAQSKALVEAQMQGSE